MISNTTIEGKRFEIKTTNELIQSERPYESKSFVKLSQNLSLDCDDTTLVCSLTLMTNKDSSFIGNKNFIAISINNFVHYPSFLIFTHEQFKPAENLRHEIVMRKVRMFKNSLQILRWDSCAVERFYEFDTLKDYKMNLVFVFEHLFTKCKEAGYFRSAENCSKYSHCVDYKGSGIFNFTFTCPSNQFFNLRTNECDQPKNVPECESSIMIKSSKAENVNRTYSEANYLYILRREQKNSEQWTTKLGIVNAKNFSFTGYFESSLNCEDQNSKKTYSYAQSAFLDREFKLLVTFNRFDNVSNRIDSSEGSIVCSFDLINGIDYFKNKANLISSFICKIENHTITSIGVSDSLLIFGTSTFNKSLAYDRRDKRLLELTNNLPCFGNELSDNSFNLSGNDLYFSDALFCLKLDLAQFIKLELPVTACCFIYFLYFAIVSYKLTEKYYQQSLLDREELADILIKESCITKYEEIGKGNFGCVYRGKLTTKDSEYDVALKTIDLISDRKSAIRRATNELIEETLIMKNFKHENVLILIGLCVQKNSLPLIVLPFMGNGSLKRFIRDTSNTLTVRDLLRFATDVASGMSYLSSLEVIHRDLATRNCMMTEDLVVKISDFGLMRDVYELHYYRIKKNFELPIRWLAPECILEFIATVESDVWSYGVLLWELFTRGDTPYPSIPANYGLQSVFEFIKNGNRMPKPEKAPLPIYDLMLSCWHKSPNQRPKFNQIIEFIENLISNSSCKELYTTIDSSIKYCYYEKYVEQYYAKLGFSFFNVGSESD